MIDCGAGIHSSNRCGVDEDTVKKIINGIGLILMIVFAIAISAIENS